MRKRIALAGAAAALVAAAAWASPAGPTTTVRIVMRYSQFAPSSITVPAGTTVRFVLENRDPIPHEFILGDDLEQVLHETAADGIHDGRPGQASLAVGETKVLFFTFDEPGVLLFGCHRPGHYDYGMRGAVVVAP